jgi:hypothetical protein
LGSLYAAGAFIDGLTQVARNHGSTVPLNNQHIKWVVLLNCLKAIQFFLIFAISKEKFMSCTASLNRTMLK